MILLWLSSIFPIYIVENAWANQCGHLVQIPLNICVDGVDNRDSHQIYLIFCVQSRIQESKMYTAAGKSYIDSNKLLFILRQLYSY